MRMSGAPSPDGRHDDLDAAELEGLALLVPDDPRSLDDDRRAYYLELKAKAAGRTARRLRRIPSPVFLVAVLAAMALIGSGLAAIAPRGGSLVGFSTPLAATPSATPGQVGGLLPEGSVTINGQPQETRIMRPAALVLVPDNCSDCAPVLSQLLQQTTAAGVRLVLVGSPGQADRLDSLNNDTLGGNALVAIDPNQTLATAYDAVGVTAVLVHIDGVVGTVARDLTPSQSLKSALGSLDQAGAPVSFRA